jgi:hypothetical protein
MDLLRPTTAQGTMARPRGPAARTRRARNGRGDPPPKRAACPPASETPDELTCGAGAAVLRGSARPALREETRNGSARTCRGRACGAPARRVLVADGQVDRAPVPRQHPNG